MSFSVFLLRVLRKLNLLNRINFSFQANFGGSSFRIPIIQGIGIDHFFPSEGWMENFLRKLMSARKGIFVDVGVNIGQTLLVVKGLEPDREYIGFEPNPQCVFYTNVLIKKNTISRTKILPAGIFSFDGVAKLYHNEKKVEDSCATLLKEFREITDMDYTLVPVISGNSVGSILETEVAIIKIDVEGAELEVLQQLQSTISKFRPFVICEILPAYSKENEFRMTRKNKIETLMRNQKYKIAQIGHQLKELNEIPVQGNPEESNFLFYPEEIQFELH